MESLASAQICALKAPSLGFNLSTSCSSSSLSSISAEFLCNVANKYVDSETYIKEVIYDRNVSALFILQNNLGCCSTVKIKALCNDQMKFVDNEIAICKLLTIHKDKHVLPIDSYILDNTHLLIFCPYIKGVDLCDYIEENPIINHDSYMSICVDISKGLQFLHKHNIIHRDLKPKNVIISEGKCARIIDYDLSYISKEPHIVENHVGTYSVISPESYNVLIYHKPSDIWSFGVIMYFMSHINHRYPCIVNNDELYKDGYRNNVFSNISYYDCDEIYIPFMKRMLCIDPYKRDTSRKICERLTVYYKSINGSNKN